VELHHGLVKLSPRIYVGWNRNSVVGQDELEAEAVNIRNRDDEVQGREETVKLNEALEKLVKLRESKAAVSKL